MSEIPSPRPDSPSEIPDWLDEWAREQRLGVEETQTWLRDTFRRRYEQYTQEHPGRQPWVVPFYYQHVDSVDEELFVGAVWLPDNDTQALVDDVGVLIHHALVMDMEDSVKPVGARLSSLFLSSRLRLVGDTLTVYTGYDYVFTQPEVQEQVLRDFGVQITTR